MNFVDEKYIAFIQISKKCRKIALLFNSGSRRYPDIYTHLIRYDRGKSGLTESGRTVQENVMYPLEMFSDMTDEEKVARARFCLERVNMPERAFGLMPSEISGGMQKRVAIARAIALNPKYLFCDEPNSGLDPQTSVVIDNLIQDITKEFNITTIINTHDMNSVMEIGEKIVYIHEGHKWWEGSKDDILLSDNPELNDFVFASAMAKRAKSVAK